MPLAPHTRLGPYQIVSAIGAGGMGEVYKARDTRLNREVAIKVLHSGRKIGEHEKRRFLLEARSASALNHPNIVTVYDVGAEGDVDFIVMEFVPGRTLDWFIGPRGLKLSDLIHYAVQIADALGKAHAAGIIHRDLKPGNIMVNDDGQVKVLDFGLAKVAEKPAESDATMSAQPRTEEGAVVGTVAYMSPEQAQGLPVDARSDIFAFGSVLYEMATGQRAFRGEAKVSILAAIIEKEPAAIAGVPPRLDQIIRHCLRKEPGKRSQNLFDVKLALEDLAEESASGRAQAVAPRRPRRAIAAVAGLALAGAFAAWIYFRPAGDVPQPIQAVPLTSDPGRELQPAFSPDGNQVAYSWNGDSSNFDIFLKVIGADSRLRVTTDPAIDLGAAWSSDGRFLYFLRFKGSWGAVMEIPALGGQERILTDFRWPRRNTSFYPRVNCSPDGKWLVVSGPPGARTGPDAVFAVSVGSGEIRQLTTPPPGHLGDVDPTFSPDGKRLVFTRSASPAFGRPYVLDLDANLKPKGEPRPFGKVSGLAAWPTWLAGGDGILAAHRQRTIWGFVRFSSETAEGVPVPLQTGGTLPAISHARSRLAFTVELEDRNVWQVGLASEGAKPGDPKVVSPSTKLDLGGDYSPDGSKIAFSSDRSGSGQIWAANSDGSSAFQVTSLGEHGSVRAPTWSPDGGKIAFDANPDGHYDVYVINARGGLPRRLVAHPGRDMAPNWSRDGKWIYFCSDRSGSDQVWKIPSDGGEPVQVTKGGGVAAVESFDGQTLYYTKSENESEVWSLALTDGMELPLLKDISRRMFAVTRQGVYYVNTSRVLTYRSFATGIAKELVLLPSASGPGLSVTADGRRILYTRLDQRTSDLMLVEGFR